MPKLKMNFEQKSEKLQEETDRLGKILNKQLIVDLPSGWSVSETFESPYCSIGYSAGTDMLVENADETKRLSARVEIMSSTEYEERMKGWGFGFASTWEDGRVGPGETMYNYTRNVWTLDKDEMENRIDSLELEIERFSEAIVDETKKEE